MKKIVCIGGLLLALLFGLAHAEDPACIKSEYGHYCYVLIDPVDIQSKWTSTAKNFEYLKTQGIIERYYRNPDILSDITSACIWEKPLFDARGEFATSGIMAYTLLEGGKVRQFVFESERYRLIDLPEKAIERWIKDFKKHCPLSGTGT